MEEATCTKGCSGTEKERERQKEGEIEGVRERDKIRVIVRGGREEGTKREIKRVRDSVRLCVCA